MTRTDDRATHRPPPTRTPFARRPHARNETPHAIEKSDSKRISRANLVASTAGETRRVDRQRSEGHLIHQARTPTKLSWLLSQEPATTHHQLRMHNGKRRTALWSQWRNRIGGRVGRAKELLLEELARESEQSDFR